VRTSPLFTGNVQRAGASRFPEQPLPGPQSGSFTLLREALRSLAGRALWRSDRLSQVRRVRQFAHNNRCLGRSAEQRTLLLRGKTGCPFEPREFDNQRSSTSVNGWCASRGAALHASGPPADFFHIISKCALGCLVACLSHDL